MNRFAVLLIAASSAHAAGPSRAGAAPPSISFTGRVMPAASVTLRARVSGVVEEVLVKEGQLVKKGELLVRLDGRLLKAELARAEAVLVRAEARATGARADLARMKKLLMARAIAKEESERAQAAADEAVAAVAVARAELELAKLKLDMTTIRAPFDGRAGRIHATQGGTAKADETPLAVVESVAMVAAIDVDERSFLKTFAPMLRVKGRIAAEVATAGGKKYEGRVSHLACRVDPATGTIRAHVSVTGEGLLPGLFVTVTVKSGKPSP